MIKELLQLKYINKLKETYRFNSVKNKNGSIRKESSAEHSWSCIVLADYFLTSFEFNVDRLKVYELLLYHDLHEIESGDFPLDPNIKHINKKEKETKAIQIVCKKIPLSISNKYDELIFEFEHLTSKEAKFAKAIDVFDS